MSGTKIHQSIPQLKKNFQICAAFVNAFCSKIEADKNDWNHIGDMMLSNRNQPNSLSAILHRIPNTSFHPVINLTLFPKLTYAELKNVSLGSYQIRLAKSYCQSHVRANNNTFTINVCDDVNTCNRYCGAFLNGSNPLLLSIDLLSRFQSNKYHKAYLLLGFDGKYSVKGYCCSCRHGCRTVGCCGHVMLMIWFTLYIDQNDMAKLLPSPNLSHTFDDWQDESDNDIELELESESDSSLSFDSESHLSPSSDNDTH